MNWAPRINKNEKRKLDADVRCKFTAPGQASVLLKRQLLDRIQPSALLDEMPQVPRRTKEEITQREDRKGRTSAAGLFLDEAPRYEGWALAFLDALHNNGMGDLAKKLCEDYRPLPDEDDFDDDPRGGGGGNDGGGGNGSFNGDHGGDGGKNSHSSSITVKKAVEHTSGASASNSHEQSYVVHQREVLEEFNRNQPLLAENRNLNRFAAENIPASGSPPEVNVMTQRAVATECPRISQLRDQRGLYYHTPSPTQNPQDALSNTVSRQVNDAVATGMNITPTQVDISAAPFPVQQYQYSSTSSNSQSNTVDRAMRPPASHVAMRNTGHSTDKISSDTSNASQNSQLKEQLDALKHISLDDSHSYLHPVDFSRFGLTSSVLTQEEHERHEPSATDNDISVKYSRDSNECSVEATEEVLIENEKTVLTSDTEYQREGNSTDLINFNSNVVHHPPTNTTGETSATTAAAALFSLTATTVSESQHTNHHDDLEETEKD